MHFCTKITSRRHSRNAVQRNIQHGEENNAMSITTVTGIRKNQSVLCRTVPRISCILTGVQLMQNSVIHLSKSKKKLKTKP